MSFYKKVVKNVSCTIYLVLRTHNSKEMTKEHVILPQRHRNCVEDCFFCHFMVSGFEIVYSHASHVRKTSLYSLLDVKLVG